MKRAPYFMLDIDHLSFVLISFQCRALKCMHIHMRHVTPVTKMIVIDTHNKLHHGGVSVTVTALCQVYWIPAI